MCYIILLLVLYSIKYLWEWKTVWYIYSLIISWCLSFGLRINVQHRTQIKYIKLIHICSVIEFIAIIHSLILSRSKTLKNFNFDKKKSTAESLSNVRNVFNSHATFFPPPPRPPLPFPSFFLINIFLSLLKQLINQNTYIKRGIVTKDPMRRFQYAMKLYTFERVFYFALSTAEIFFEPSGTFKWKVIRADSRNILHIRWRSIDVVLVMIMKYKQNQCPVQNHNITYHGMQTRACGR